MNTNNKMKRVGANLTRVLSLGLLIGTASCDTTVVNPGPINADFLNDPASQAAITNGAGRALADAMNWISYTGAAVAREIHPSGSTASFGISPDQQAGMLEADEVGTHWSNAHRARFLAADGIARITALDAGDQDQEVLAQIYLWAGFSSRLLGESMCESVIDGGVPGSSDVHLNNAVAFFTQAATLGTGDVALAAVAGRASAHVGLGAWGSAATDAAAVVAADADFSYELPYFDIGDDTQSNRIYVASKNTPYKAHSTIFTWVDGYGLSPSNPTGDPRMPWDISGENGDASTSCCGLVLFNPQTKHDSDDSGIELTSGAQMTLILAENEIMNNGAPGLIAGMALINGLRTGAGMAAEVGATQADATTWLKREHAIETWLEARRLPAMRRWAANGTPGSLQPLEEVGDSDIATGAHLTTRDFCFPISEGERQTNPNIS